MDNAVAGASAGLRVMVDGTVRVTLDFEPKDAAAVMAMFGKPGAPIACARLADGFAAKPDKPADERGPLCREACDLCRLVRFHHYIESVSPHVTPANEATAKGWLLRECGIAINGSRKELDHDPQKAAAFRRVTRDFQAWLRRQKA